MTETPTEVDGNVDAGTVEVTCQMTHAEPYDFAECETHDTTFPLGERCKFYGREMWLVFAEEADEQRGLKVRAEMNLGHLLYLVQIQAKALEGAGVIVADEEANFIHERIVAPMLKEQEAT